MHAVVQRLAANMAGGMAATEEGYKPEPHKLSEEASLDVNAWVGRIDAAFRKQDLETAFAYAYGLRFISCMPFLASSQHRMEWAKPRCAG